MLVIPCLIRFATWISVGVRPINFDDRVSDIGAMISPYIEKLQKNRLDEESITYVNIIKSNLEEIIAPISDTPLFQKNF